MTVDTRLPALDSDYVVAPDEVANFRRDGHVLLRSVATPREVAAYRPAISAAVERYKTESRPLEERDTYGKAFLQVMNLWQHDDAVRRFVFARRFAHIAAALLEVPAVRLYHDQALYKEAYGGPTPWHQDQYYWPFDSDRTVTLWMPLVDVEPDMGPLTFASGSHVPEFRSEVEISDESDDLLGRTVEAEKFPVVNAPMRPGDATYHLGWTMHCAPANHTGRMREVMTVIYFADGLRILEPTNPHRRNDLATWMPGQKPGECAASPLNPLLYPA